MSIGINEGAIGLQTGDDIDMLLNVISQLTDLIGVEADGVSVPVPDATIHQKYWAEISARELCDAMERKYTNAPRLNIPNEFTTSF